MKTKLATLLAFAASPFAVLAADAEWTVPASVTTAMNDLTSAAGKIAEVEIPYVQKLGLAFLGVTLFLAVFGLLKYMIRKATPGSRG